MPGRTPLESALREFRRQPDLLSSFVASPELRGLPSDQAPILVGAGDSYAAAVSASYLAGPPTVALDPYSLFESLEWAGGRHVCILSVSGETRSNIELANALKGVAKSTVGITSNPDSRFASAVEEVVRLPFRPVGKSPGIASFALSLTAVLRLTGLDPRCDFRKALSRGSTGSRKLRIAGGSGITHLVSNNGAYGACVYGAAKIYELTGGRAQVSPLEEFSHMPLFSLRRSDTVNIIVGSQAGEKGKALESNLERAGYSASLLELPGTKVEALFSLVFSLQMAAIEEALRQGRTGPYFLGAKKKLKISDAMIY